MMCAVSHPLFAELLANAAYFIIFNAFIGGLIYAIRRY